MRDYQKVFYALSLVVVLFMHLGVSPARFPAGFIEPLLLLFTSGVLLAGALNFRREKRRMAFLFHAALALCPWLYYLEVWLIRSCFGAELPPDLLEKNLLRGSVVYNLMKYSLALFALFSALGSLWRALKDFYHQEYRS